MKVASRSIVFAALLAAFALPSKASASPLFEVVGPLGGNAGFQGVVSGPGAASTYFDPALLADARDEVLLGFSLASEQMGVTLEGRDGGSVPLIVAGRNILVPSGSGFQPLPNAVVPTQWLAQGCPAGTQAGQCPAPGFAPRPRQGQGTSGVTRSYLVLGFVKRLVRDRLTLGAYGMLPISSFTTAQAFYPDEREALFSNSLHPELYGDRMTAVSMAFGASFEILPELSIGASASLTLSNTAVAKSYVQDASDYSTLLTDTQVSTTVGVAPTVGVRWRPAPWLRIAGAIHAPEQLTVGTTIQSTLPSGTDAGATQNDVFDWMPWQVSTGVEADVDRRHDQTLSVVASLTYSFWSSYVDRHGDSPSIYGADLAWRDTASGAVGVRETRGPVRTFLDLRYVPSPVPEQVGRSNYVDNDRFGVTAGGDVTLRLPAGLRPGLQFFADRLVPRSNRKDDARIVDELPDNAVTGGTHDPVPGARGLQTNNPGWPGFSSGGFIWGGTVTLSVPL